MTATTKQRVVSALAALAIVEFAAAQGCVGDVVADGRVDGGDLGTLLANWGSVTSSAVSAACDLHPDGIVDGADLGVLLAAWGPCPVPVVPSWATLVQAQPDAAVVTVPALRQAILSSGFAWRVRDTSTQIEMVLIPPGVFAMGCSASNQHACSSAEDPVHIVTISSPFYLGRYEVTQSQWTARMGSNPSFLQSATSQVPSALVPNRPVENVSWNGIQTFLAVTGLRLPTEAEWEYSYRAGTATAFHGLAGSSGGTNDEALVSGIAWHDTNSSGQTRPVGGKAGNGFGLHDMSGNVWEWVNDWYSPTYYATSPAQDPQGPATGSARVLRGGAWDSWAQWARSSYRISEPPMYGYNDFGFRVARNP